MKKMMELIFDWLDSTALLAFSSILLSKNLKGNLDSSLYCLIRVFRIKILIRLIWLLLSIQKNVSSNILKNIIFYL